MIKLFKKMLMGFSLSNYWSSKSDVVSVAKLKKAMNNNQLELYFLPVISMQDEKTVELEALLRWHLSGDEYIPPMKFIPIAEQNGLMPDLTRWVIERLISLIKEWQDSGIKLNWSMNISPYDLKDVTLISDIKTELNKADISTDILGVEISHSIMRTASTQTLDFLLDIRSEGMRLILDNYDLKYAIDESILPELWSAIKIDRKLIMELRLHPENLDTIQQFLQRDEYNNIICLPGVNSYFEWEKIQSLNCHQAQGFYLSPPQSPHDTKLWLQVSKWAKHTDNHIDSESLHKVMV